MRRKRPPTHLSRPDQLPSPVQPRSPIFLLLFLVVVVVGVVFLLRSAERAARPAGQIERTAAQPSPERLEAAVAAVENAAAAIAAPGWTPERLARRLAESLDARPGPIRYVVGRPTAPWQVALVPDPDARVVRVEGYGTDLTLPLLVTEIQIP